MNRWPSTFAIALLLLNFLILPLLDDIDKTTKYYAFVFATLPVALCFITSVKFLRVSLISFFFVLFSVSFILSASQSFDPFWAFIQAAVLCVYVLLLVMVVHYSSSVSDFKQQLLNVLLFFGLLSSLLGLYQYTQFAIFGVSPDALIPYLLPTNVELRIGGMYGQPNLFALFLTTSLLAFFHRHVHFPDVNVRPVLGYFKYLPFFLVALTFFLTGSRAGILSLTLVFGFLVWLVASGRYLNHQAAEKKEFFRLVMFLGAALIAAQFLGWLLNPEAVREARSLGAAGMNTSSRFVFWASAWLIFLDHPWLGTGLDTYKFLMNSYGPKSHELLGFVFYESMIKTSWVHNELLHILCEGGVLAFSIIVIPLGIFLKKIIRNFIFNKRFESPEFFYFHLLLLPFIIQSMFSYPLRHPALLALFVVFVGILLSQYPLKRIPLTASTKFCAILILLVGLCGAGWLFGEELKISAFKRKFISAERAADVLNDLELLTSNSYTANSVLSKVMTRYFREALAENGTVLTRKIIPYFEYLSQHTGEYWHWYDLAALYLKIGDFQRAHQAVHQAIDLKSADNQAWDLLKYINNEKYRRNKLL